MRIDPWSFPAGVLLLLWAGASSPAAAQQPLREVAGGEDVHWSAEQLQQRAALIYVQHVAFSLTGARDKGRTAAEQGRWVGEIVARYKQRLFWDESSDALLSNALAKLIQPDHAFEFGRATFMLRSRYERAARELARYGSSIEEYVDWLQAMHAAIGQVQGYAMTAGLDGDWLVETYSDLPNRKELKPATDLPLYELSSDDFQLYEGVYMGTLAGDTATMEYTMRVWEEDGRLGTATWRSGEREPYGRHLVPVARDVFLPGWYTADGRVEVPRNALVRFSPTDAGPAEAVELEVEGGGEVILWQFRRVQ